MKFAALLRAFFIGVPFSSLAPAGHAQSGYSVNALGYADVALSSGSNFITYPFKNADARVSRLLPIMPLGTYLALWDPVSQQFGTTNHFGPAGWSDPGLELRLPAGALLWVTQAMTISFAGEWIQGSVSAVPRSSGIHLLGVMPRRAFFLCSEFTECTDAIPPDLTTICLWNRAAQQCDTYTYLDLGPESGWYDNFGNKVAVQLAPGEAALFYVPQNFYLPAIPVSSSAPSGYAITGASRTPTHFTIQFAAIANAPFVVVRTTSLPSEVWPAQLEGTTTGTIHTVTFPETDADKAFYQVMPSGQLQLFGGERKPGQFHFYYYAPDDGAYVVEQRGQSLTWTTVEATLEVLKGIRRVSHWSAATSRAEYRVRFAP